jgi:4-alpha-glucanotransferase
VTPGRAPANPLRQLARLYGLQTSYYDVDGRRQEASSGTLLSALRALGAPVESQTDVPAALRERTQARWRQVLDPVTVAWDGGPTETQLRLPAAMATGSADCELRLEQGEVRAWKAPLSAMATLRQERVEGVEFVAKLLRLPRCRPFGYHHLSVTIGRAFSEGLVLSVPSRTYEDSSARRDWGLFAPLYAVSSARSWGAGDFSDLRAFTQWVADLGGSVVATLPFLAAFLDEPFEPSPYAPVSRLMWNEFYVDVTAAPELERCPDARAAVTSLRSGPDLSRLRSERLVDYRREMALKREVLGDLARHFFEERSPRRDAFHTFLGERPEVEDYARFRAVGERLKTPWPEWPGSLRDGVVCSRDYDDRARRYHLYVQWLAREQLAEVAEAGRARGVRLHLDFPLGANAVGYDVWRERGLFVRGASAGAPPDMFFPNGQNWAFPVPDPWAQRDQAYRYFIASLRHHLEHAGSLRIDHVMGLHRLYLIPSGADARTGVYVRYPADELYAILCLESHRHGAVIVGEDLGTVPQLVRAAMSRHGLRRSYVLEIEPTVSEDRPFGRIPRACVASLNTHDLPPFAGYWRFSDIQERERLGVLPRKAAAKERRLRRNFRSALMAFLRQHGLLAARRSDARAVHDACLSFLSSSAADTLLVNLEDLWQETAPQNVPGTVREHPNWRHKGRYSLEEVRGLPRVADALRHVNLLRERTGGR